MRAFYCFALLLIYKLTYARDVNICISDYDSDECKDLSINCSFSNGEIEKLENLRERGNVLQKDSSRDSNNISKIGVGKFASSLLSDSVLFTSFLATCSAYILYDDDCGYSSLGHVLPNSHPDNTIEKMYLDYKTKCKKYKKPKTFLVLSSIKTFDQYLDMFEYRKIICEAAKKSEVHVFFSEKPITDFDSVEVVMSKGITNIIVERHNPFQSSILRSEFNF